LRWLAPLLLALTGCAREVSDVFDSPVAAVYSDAADRVFVLERGHARDAAGSAHTASIARLLPDGRTEQHRWRDGFSSQAVLAAGGDELFVADGDQLWFFDARSGAQRQRVVLNGTQLTDLAADDSGLVYTLDSAAHQVLRIAGERATALPLPAASKPLAILKAADALWILALNSRAQAMLLRHRQGEPDRQCALGEVGAQSVLLKPDQRSVGVFDPRTQRLQRWDGQCRPLLGWRIAAGGVRPAFLPRLDRLFIPQPRSGRVAVLVAPSQLLADGPGAL